jgi:serine/threonine-protein kinase RsbW
VPSLRVDARPESLVVIRGFVRAAAAAEGLNQERTDGLVQAVDESATNVIVHGYRLAPGEIEIETRRSGEELVVLLRDRAPRFDPTQVPPPDRHTPLTRRGGGGMGVYLARQLCDEMRYRSMPDGGNELALVQRASDGRNDARGVRPGGPWREWRKR